MATIIGGLVGYRLFQRLAQGISRAGRAAMEAYEWYDRIRYSLTELARAEMIDKFKDTVLTTQGWAHVLENAAEAAQELLDWTIQLALQSPFSAEDVNKMFRLIRAYGFGTQEAKSLTGQIMDFAAATGFGSQVLERMGLALGQVQQRGRLAGEEIRQLINVGIPVRDIVAKAMNVTTGELEKLIRAGKVAADVALPAILEWMKRFDGASERAVKTWQGLVANLKDVKDLNMIAFFKGIAEAAHPALQEIFDIMSSKEFRGALENLGRFFGDFIGPLMSKLPGAIQLVSKFFSYFDAFMQGQISPGAFVAGFLELLNIIDSSEIRNVATLVNDFAASFGEFRDKVGGFLDKWIGPIKDALPGWLENLSTISFASFDAFVPMFERFGESLSDISESVAPEVIQNLTDTLDGITQWWSGGGSEAVAKIIEFLFTLTSGGLAGAVLILTTAIGALIDVLSGEDPMPRLERMLDVFNEIADTVAKTPLMQEAAASAAMLTVPIPTGEGETSAGQQIATQITDSIFGGIQEEETKVAEATIAMLDRVGISAEGWSVMTGEQQMALVGKNMAAGFGQGFSAEADVQIEIMEEKLQEIIDLVNQMYELESPSKLFMRAGKNIMAGLGKGIVKGTKGMLRDVVDSAQSVSGSLTGSMQPAMATTGSQVDRSRTSNITIHNMPINNQQDEDQLLNTLKRL
jgi:tape measure domain-containing protein